MEEAMRMLSPEAVHLFRRKASTVAHVGIRLVDLCCTACPLKQLHRTTVVETSRGAEIFRIRTDIGAGYLVTLEIVLSLVS